VSQAKAGLKKAEERLVHLKQPQAYLVDTIRQRDRTLEEYKAQFDGARRENLQLSKELSETELARRNAENDLRKLLAQRHQLQTLQGIVRDLAQQPAGAALVSSRIPSADAVELNMHSPSAQRAMTTPQSSRQGQGTERPPGTPQWHTKLNK
jgi:chromosome segregation ATPase